MLAAVGTICSTASISRNLVLCQRVAKRAAEAGAKLIWLPEASDFITVPGDVGGLSEYLDESFFLAGMKTTARESGMWVGVGVHERIRDSQQCYNTNVLISPEGDVKQSYRKLHLFDVDIAGGATILESNTTKAGSSLEPPIDTAIGKIGLLTCYDLRFPECSLALRKAGAQIITYPSAFTLRTGAAHWEILLRARAIETQCYILAPAQIGSHSPTRHSYGHSMIVDPWGAIIAQGSDKIPKGKSDDEGTFVMADIDLGYLETLREEIPLWSQRRNDVYPILDV